MASDTKYYVYGYYDPRNMQLFCIGKGKGARKLVHEKEIGEASKNRTIASIKTVGESPAIKSDCRKSFRARSVSD
jgi:hypothetical protein